LTAFVSRVSLIKVSKNKAIVAKNLAFLAEFLKKIRKKKNNG
jgi:hypothetical protein